MNPADRSSGRNVLAERLRKEAQAQCPPYSASLHEGIMQRIAAERVATPSGSRRRFHFGFLGGFLATAAAAMLAVLIPAGLRWASSPPATVAIKSPVEGEPKQSPTSPASSPVPPLPPFDTALASALDPASEQLGEGRFAYLDQDAERLTRFVANQFDVLPTSR